jgi:hypothetical protein
VRVSLSTHASLWPFLHMLQRRTSSNPHSHCFFLGVKEQNILTPKLMLQRRTGSHSVFFECEFEYERSTLAFSSHAPEAHGLSN